MSNEELAIRMRIELEDKVDMSFDVSDRLEIESIIQRHLTTTRQEAMKEQRERVEKEVKEQWDYQEAIKQRTKTFATQRDKVEYGEAKALQVGLEFALAAIRKGG